MLLDNYKKQSPIVGVAGLGGGINSYIFLSGGADPYVISRSLRFNSADTSYLSKTFSSDGNRRTNTISFWIKKVKIDASASFYRIFGSQQASHVYLYEDKIFWDASTTNNNSAAGYRWTNRLFRDPSAWYHIVCTLDTTQSTASDRMRLYVNGVEETSFQGTANMGQNDQTGFSQGSIEHTFGYRSSNQGSAGGALDAYLADIHFVDGQALAPTSFGETDDNGVWQPKKFSGNHGTNGFHLDFKDNSSDAALGYDAAGSNNFTVNNLTATVPGLATANQGMDVVTYTGTGSAQSIGGLAFQPDFVWLKRRSATGNHCLSDSVRGFGASGSSKLIYSDATNSEDTGNTQIITAFNSDGFTLGTNGIINGSGSTHVAWCWKAGGAASSNSNGTITSSVSASTTYGFSVVTWTGAGTGSAKTVGHSLGAVPKFIISKSRSLSDNWGCYHVSLGNTKDIFLNTTAASRSYPTWNNTDPTSSVFSVGQTGQVNEAGATYVAYCWSEISGFSKFGSWTGNGSSTGPTITTGFKPRFLLWKKDGVANWYIYDTERQSSNPLNKNLEPNTSDAENTLTSMNIDFLSDGFQLKGTDGDMNGNGSTYIYAAFAAKPDQSAIDALIDSPSQSVADETDTGVGGQITGNYATYNPVRPGSGTKSNGNLTVTGTGQVPDVASIAPNSGKWYAEIKWDSGSYARVGLQDVNIPTSDFGNQNGQSYRYESNSGNVQPGGQTYSTYAAGDIIGVAFDCDAGKLWLAKNGTWQNSGNPAGGTGAVATNLIPGNHYAPASSSGSNSSVFTLNAGQHAFAYTAPTGFKALCTSNLPEPTIADGSQYFDTKLYTGNGANSRTISGYGFSPDFLWVKNRDNTAGDYSHRLMDAVRGAGVSLSSNGNNVERDASAQAGGGVETFTSDGFTIEQGTSNNNNQNNNNSTYVSWAWDAGSSTVTNTTGSINSQVRANQAAGFSICTYSGSGSNGTFGHGLSTAPDLVICKSRSHAQNWAVQHSALGPTYYGYLQTTNAFRTSSGTAFWNDTAPTNTTVSVGTDNDTNSSGKTYVAYCFSSIAGYSSFGKYTGNGDADGIFIYTGFAPSWLLFKRSDSSSDWSIYDTTRDPHNVAGNKLEPNTSDAESAQGVVIDILSNGFKFRRNSLENGGNDVYIYAAFASHPFQSARAR